MKLKENVLDVLMYLFENYIEDDDEPEPDREILEMKLLEAGFPDGEIKKAFEWLEALADHQDSLSANPAPNRTMRVYTKREEERLNSDCRGFLLFLEQNNIVTSTSRELIIDRVMALDTDEIDLEHLKWIILMVLFNRPGEEAAYSWLEDMVFENTPTYLH